MTKPSPCPCFLCKQGAPEPLRAHHQSLRALMVHLDERQRRWLAGTEAIRAGRGGVRLAATITGLDEKTVRRGRREVQAGLDKQPAERVRSPGAGGKRTEKNAPRPSPP